MTKTNMKYFWFLLFILIFSVPFYIWGAFFPVEGLPFGLPISFLMIFVPFLLALVYAWNNLGGLYQSFYREYESEPLSELCDLFSQKVHAIVAFLTGLSEDEVFLPGGRRWAASTPSNWPVWKWIHINTVAPFTSFRAKIRKWKKL